MGSATAIEALNFNVDFSYLTVYFSPGIVETMTPTRRRETVIAVRDTELAKLPAGLIDLIRMRFPSVLQRLVRLMGEQIQVRYREYIFCILYLYFYSWE